MADGNYITEAEQQASLARQLNLWNDTSGTFTLAYMTADRDDVEARIDSFLRGRYSVPVTATATVAYLKGLVIDLLAYKGYKRNGPGEIPESIRIAAEAATKDLIDIRDGLNRLPGQAEEPDPNGPNNFLFYEANTPLVDQDELKGY